jgi:hypothetical protein
LQQRYDFQSSKHQLSRAFRCKFKVRNCVRMDDQTTCRP